MGARWGGGGYLGTAAQFIRQMLIFAYHQLSFSFMKNATQWAGQQGRLLVLALLGCGGLAPLMARAQAPANDDPCGAVTLLPLGSLCTTPTVSTNAGATTTVPNGYANPSASQAGCGAGGNAPKDVWFAFTTAATGPASFGATVTVSGNVAGLVRLYAAPACTGPFTEVQCSSAGQANTVAPRLTTGALRPNTRYYLQVAGYADADPTGSFTVCLTDGPGLPTCGPPTLGTPTYPSATTATVPLVLGVNNTFPVTVLVTGPGGFSQTTTANASPLQLSGLTQGTAYTVRVAAPCAASGQTGASVATPLRTPTRYCSAGLGGGCGLASITEVEIQGTTLRNNSQSPPCGPPYVNWPATGSTTGTLRPGTTYQLGVRLFNSTASDYVTGWIDFNQNNAFDANEVVLPRGPSNAATTLFYTFLVPLNAVPGPTGLRIRSEQNGSSTLGPGAACASLLSGGETEDYTVTIGIPAVCPAPSGLALSNLTSNSATLSFTPVPGVNSYVVTTDCFTGVGFLQQTYLVAGSPVQLVGLVPNTSSSVSIVASCGPGSVSSGVGLSFIPPQGPSVNDECLNATLLVPGTNPIPTHGTTNYGSVSAPAPTPTASCAVPINQDVWYRFVATLPAHEVVIDAEPRATLLLDVFSGTCNGGFQRIGCANQIGSFGGPPMPPLVLNGLTPGQTYYIRVAQTSTATAYAFNFDISIRNSGSGYCLTGLGGNLNCTGPNITSLVVVGTSLNNTPTDACTSNGIEAYTSFPADGLRTATLRLGQTYQLQATLSGTPADASLWIDYNQNYLFEPSEHTQVGLAATGLATANFVVPATAVLGATRMRLRTRAAGVGNGPADACTNFPASGETEDYTVTLARPLATASRALSAQLALYPNPAHRAVTLQVPVPLRPTAPAGLYNALGQRVLQQALAATPGGAETVLPLGGLAPGVYVLRLSTTAGVLVKRLVVE